MPDRIVVLNHSDNLPARLGDVIASKVSSHLIEGDEARLVHIVSADSNPDEPGMVEEAVAAGVAETHASRSKPTTQTPRVT
ncbi:MAG: hypothetical protein ACR2RA_23990 [Geminicoccaceae bacterium]